MAGSQGTLPKDKGSERNLHSLSESAISKNKIQLNPEKHKRLAFIIAVLQKTCLCRVKNGETDASNLTTYDHKRQRYIAQHLIVMNTFWYERKHCVGG